MLFYHLSTPILRHSWPFFKHYNMYKCTTVLLFVIYKSYIHMCTMLSTKLGTLGTFTPICALANIAVIHSSNIAVQKNVYKVLLGSVVHLRKHFSEWTLWKRLMKCDILRFVLYVVIRSGRYYLQLPARKWDRASTM